MGRRILFHHHLFKNAGTTVDACLERSFGGQFVTFDSAVAWHTYSANDVAARIREEPSAQAFSSHQVALLPPAIDGIEVDRLIFLRHPIDRVRSVYSFERRQKADSPGARMASQTDLAGYVRWRLETADPTVVSGFQTARLSAVRVTPPGASASPRGTGPQAALAALKELELIGVVERLDESLCLLELELKQHWPTLDLAYISANVDPQRANDLEQRIASVRASLPSDLWNNLEERNRADLECHTIAGQRLDSAIRGTANFSAHLGAFRERCAALAARNSSWASRLRRSGRNRVVPGNPAGSQEPDAGAQSSSRTPGTSRP